MRDSKYRAWDKEDKRMITDTQDFIPLVVTNKGVLKLSPLHEENLYSIMPIDRFELMPSTGLKDKNGVEIYDGDIVKIHNIGYANRGVIAKVEYNDGCFDLVGDNWRDYLKCYTCNHAVTVIENIYENPDLLEVQHED